MMLDDERLCAASRQARDDLLAGLPDEAMMDHEFSESFEWGMDRLIHQQRQSPWQRSVKKIARRAAVIVAVAFVGLSATVLSVDAWREMLFEMVEEKFPEYSSIRYEPVDSSSAVGFPEFDLVELRPDIPEGFILTDQILDTHVNWSNYRDRNDNFISFNQSILGTSTSAINTENSELTKFELSNGDTAYKMRNNGANFVLWNDNQYEYMILTQGPDMDLDGAIALAESVTICPPDAPHPPQLERSLFDLEPEDEYPEEQAIENGDVVITQDGVLKNGQVLQQFFDDVKAGKQSILAIADYTLGDPLTRELYYDGLQVRVTTDERRYPENPGEGTSEVPYEQILTEERDGGTVVLLIDDEGQQTQLLSYVSEG